MGHKGVNTEQAQREAHTSASNLHQRATAFLALSGARPDKFGVTAIETPDGAVIERVEDVLF